LPETILSILSLNPKYRRCNFLQHVDLSDARAAIGKRKYTVVIKGP
jgi:hypothetical protein